MRATFILLLSCFLLIHSFGFGQVVDLTPYAICKQGNFVGLTEGLGDLPDTEPGVTLAEMVYDGAVYIPDSINGFALTVLNYPYFGMGYMREVRLPETLTYLYGDFGSNLRSFNIPKNLYYFYVGGFGELDSIALPIPEKENHRFLGWKKYDSDIILPGGTLVKSSSGHYYAYFEYVGEWPYKIGNEDVIFYDGEIKECYYWGAKKIILPSSFNGHKVEEIHFRVFNNFELEAVVIEEGYDKIDGFFQNKISQISLPNSLRYVIGFNENRIAELELPPLLDSIGRGAFARNLIKELIIPRNVKKIDRSAFTFNDIESLELPESLTFIGSKAFQNNKLTDVKLPNSIKKLYESTFSDNRIEFVTLPQQLEYIGDSCFKNNQLSKVDIPLTVVHIAPGAFGNNQIESVQLPQNLNYVSGFDSNRLSEISLPAALDTIGGEAFAFNNLIEVNLPGKVKVVEDAAFFKNQIERIAWSDLLVQIGAKAFQQNDLSEVILPKKVQILGAQAFCDNKIAKLQLPKSLEYIGAACFKNNQLSMVAIPSQVTFIGEDAFSGNPFLASAPRLPKPQIIGKSFLYWKGEVLIEKGKVERTEQCNSGDIIRDGVRYTAVFEE